MIDAALQYEGYFVAIGGTVFMGILAFMGWAVRKYFVTHDALGTLRAADAEVVNKLARTVDKLTDRVVALEQKVNALPTEAMFNNLNLRLETFAGEQKATNAKIAGLQTSVEGIGRTVASIQEILMGRGK